ncbi:MAG: ATP-binding protein [Synechococcaceae cyanobacterium]|nr:ATP-binding protein [Synechococcaceae cyanobacterium]
MQLSLRIPGHSSALPSALEQLEEFLLEARVPETVGGEIRLIAEEALANILEHARTGGNPPGEVGMLLERIGGELVLEFDDDGPPFDPLRHTAPAPPPTFEARLGGGCGLLLLDRLADGMAYSRRGGRNVLRLRKRIARAA